MGQVGGLSSNGFQGLQFQTQEQQNQMNQLMGVALIGAFLSNDPQQIAGALGALAMMDPRAFLMMLGAVNPELFNQLAQALGQQQGAGQQQPSGGQQFNSGVPLADMIMNGLMNRRNGGAGGGGGDSHVVAPRNVNRSQQTNRPRAPNEPNVPMSPGSTDGRPVANAQVYRPGSPEAIALFREAARVAGVPESWASSQALHNILSRESGGVVGRPNYTYGRRANDRSQWDDIHNELKNGRITARSSATGLGQLLLSNVDRYYPNGRAGIGDPVQEAAGMLRYIQSRYGSPEVAWARYNTRHEGY